MKTYTPANWYWFVGGDQSRAFSSAIGDYVPASDPAFIAWQADGAVPTAIDTEANLASVLAPNIVRPVTATILDAYQGSQADMLLSNLIFRMLFNHENRIRALEGKPAVTVAQARAAIKALM